MPGEKLILTAGPSISEKEVEYVMDAARNGWNSNWNAYLLRFEKAFAEYIGVKYAMTTSSCTGAMHVGLTAMGIGPGDEVILPEITWVATASVLSYVGAKPVFADIEKDTWCLSPDSLESHITERTRAIMPVHNYGNLCDMDAIMNIARKHNLLVLEDAAPSIGATFKGKKTGSFGDAGAFSFQGAKIMTTGEGGMFVTDNDELMERVKKLADHGRSLTRALWNDEVGYKYKMSNLQAAFGLAQLERIEEMVNKKRLIMSWYRGKLDNIDGLLLSHERKDMRSIFWMPSIVLEKDFAIARDDVLRELRKRNVDARPIFYPLSDLPMFESHPENTTARIIAKGGINLPGGHERTQEEIEYVCKCIREILCV